MSRLRAGSCRSPACCCSTSRSPRSTRSRGIRMQRLVKRLVEHHRPGCCSSRTTWTRPSRSRIARSSCATARLRANMSCRGTHTMRCATRPWPNWVWRRIVVPCAVRRTAFQSVRFSPCPTNSARSISVVAPAASCKRPSLPRRSPRAFAACGSREDGYRASRLGLGGLAAARQAQRGQFEKTLEKDGGQG